MVIQKGNCTYGTIQISPEKDWNLFLVHIHSSLNPSYILYERVPNMDFGDLEKAIEALLLNDDLD